MERLLDEPWWCCWKNNLKCNSDIVEKPKVGGTALGAGGGGGALFSYAGGLIRFDGGEDAGGPLALAGAEDEVLKNDTVKNTPVVAVVAQAKVGAALRHGEAIGLFLLLGQLEADGRREHGGGAARHGRGAARRGRVQTGTNLF